jgi:hypothetical protein
MERDLLLTPGNHSLLLLDYQYLQLLTTRSQNPVTILSRVVTLSKSADLFNVPVLLSTAFAEQQDLVTEVARLFPGQRPVDRNTMNAMEDADVCEWTRYHNRKRLVIAGLWTEVCVKLSAMKALQAGYEVYVISDACGGASSEEHQKALECMATAGIKLLSTESYVSEVSGKQQMPQLFETQEIGWSGQLRNYLLSRQVYADYI